MIKIEKTTGIFCLQAKSFNTQPNSLMEESSIQITLDLFASLLLLEPLTCMMEQPDLKLNGHI